MNAMGVNPFRFKTGAPNENAESMNLKKEIEQVRQMEKVEQGIERKRELVIENLPADPSQPKSLIFENPTEEYLPYEEEAQDAQKKLQMVKRRRKKHRLGENDNPNETTSIDFEQ